MKPSHYTTPRTLETCTFQPWGEATHGFSSYQPRRERIAGYLLAAAIGVAGALALVAWSTT